MDRRQPVMRWGAVFGGAVLALGLWIMLQVLGTGIGLATVDRADAGTLRNAGIGTGIWSLIAPLIALFIGGVLAGRLSASRDRGVGGWHGAVMWGVTLVVGLYMMTSAVSSIAGGIMRAGGAVASGAAGAASKIDTGDAMRAIGIDTSDLLAAVNEKLEAEGKPPVTARELQATMRGVVRKGIRDGKLDREVFVQELVGNTKMSRAEAEDIAARFSDKIEEGQRKIERFGERAKEVGLEAADKTGKVLLLGGLMMLLSLGSAIGGAVLGAHRNNGRRYDDDDVTRTTLRTTVAPPPAPAPVVVEEPPPTVR